MPGGTERFRDLHFAFAEKIDSDPNISVAERLQFWVELDDFPDDDDSQLLSGFIKLCSARQWTGPEADPPFVDGEQLGSAQYFEALVNDLSSQMNPSDPLPPSTPAETRLDLSRILRDLDEARALSKFKNLYTGLRLRSLRYGSGTRIFAFRNPRRPLAPLSDGGLAKLFDRLAIPNGRPENYILLAFDCTHIEHARIPNCFDANLHNLSLFLPGGVTAPPHGLQGLPELVVTPPLCDHITYPPRSIR